jgi:hypothetical protein
VIVPHVHQAKKVFEMGIVKRQFLVVIVAAVAMLVSACSPNPPSADAAPVPGQTVLWSDVPVFKDSTPDLNTNQFINQLATQMFSLTYYSPKTPAEVAAFYSDDLMAKNGWSPQSHDIVNHFSVGHGQGAQIPKGETSGGCEMDEFHGQPGALCTFSKLDDSNRDIELTIDASADDKSDQTLLLYTRTIGSVVKK